MTLFLTAYIQITFSFNYSSILREEQKKMNDIPLTKLQKEIIEEFYSVKPTKVVFNKAERNKLWKKAKAKQENIDFANLEKTCPALSHQIKKSYTRGTNIQSAVFSECVYAQTFANMLNLDVFTNCKADESFIPNDIKHLLKSYNLYPRYSYSNKDKSRMLIQAGGCNGIDSALITVMDLNIYTIEFKEPGAKTSEPDLPKYKEDGVLQITEEFVEKYPQFEKMLKEQIGLNFFSIIGSNVNDFSKDSVKTAVSDNYVKKYADVICTEDADGYLVMMPANQVSLWATVCGEIRPAGRNSYKVWTPNALKRFLKNKEAKFSGNIAEVEKSKLEPRKARGGNGKISGYKINPLFFVRLADCQDNGTKISFDINKVWQLKPTIAVKMFFKNLKHDKIKEYYIS